MRGVQRPKRHSFRADINECSSNATNNCHQKTDYHNNDRIPHLAACSQATTGVKQATSRHQQRLQCKEAEKYFNFVIF